MGKEEAENTMLLRINSSVIQITTLKQVRINNFHNTRHDYR